VIRLRQVSFAYRETEPVLAGVDLEIGPGLTLLLGPNGCGKSTLLKLMAGIEQPDSGRIEIGGHDLWTDEVAARRGLAYVPEQPDLTPYATVREVLDLVCRLRGEPRERGREALERAGLGNLTHRSVRELSMGQRRRAVLAAAFVGTPRQVLLDEPLEAMDRGAREDLLAWTGRLVELGAAVVVVSHEIEPFVAGAARALAVRGGRCLDAGALPGEPGERLALLDRLARGEVLSPP
jgi:ABC-type multidrug transport system ATPase subunit